MGASEGAGIWGSSPVADDAGNVYFLTGNALADPVHQWYGDSGVKLSPSGGLGYVASFTPYDPMRLLEQLKGDDVAAIGRFEQAIEREDQNWTLYYLKAKAQHQAGENGAAQATLEEAQRLNPLETCLTEGFEGCG